jgi:hypothetical protein
MQKGAVAQCRYGLMFSRIAKRDGLNRVARAEEVVGHMAASRYLCLLRGK